MGFTDMLGGSGIGC